jgi:hypothetical protein
VTASHRPSWVDRLIGLIERLPVPTLVFYVALYLFGSFLIHMAVWIDGVAPWGETVPARWVDSVWVIIGLGFIHYLRNASMRAMDQFAPLLADDPGTVSHLRSRLASMPARPVFWLSVAFAAFIVFIFVIGDEVAYEGMAHPAAYACIMPLVVFSYSFAGVMALFGVRLLRTIGMAYRSVDNISVFRQEPLHAFSGVTLRASLFFLLIANLNFLSVAVDPAREAPIAIDLVLSLITIAFAVATFIIPLVGVHRRLRDKKQRVLDENGQHLEEVSVRLYRSIDAGSMADMEAFEKATASLYRIRSEVRGAHTWPWAPGTLRTFLTAVLLPMLLWAGQYWLTQVL